MAKTIDHLTLTVGVTAYEHEGCQYDALLIIVAYYKGRGFCVSWQPVKLTGYGYQTGPMPSSDPLVNGGAFVAKAATKNSVKTLEQMRTNLEAAREGIKYYFDQRDFDGLKKLMGDVANYGYPYDREQQIKQLINNNINNQTSRVMATKENNQKNESVNVQNNAQVNNEVESVAVGEMTVDSIMPRMSAEPEEPVKVAGSEYQVSDGKGGSVTFESVIPAAIAKAATEGTATTMPLGQHGTLVIGGVPKPTEKPKVTLKKKTPQPAPIAEPSTLSRVRLTTFTTKRGETAPRIIGFSGEDDPRWKQHYAERMALAKAVKAAKAKDPKAKGQSDPFGASWMTDHQTGTVTYCMTFGVRYMDVAKQLCEAYNTTDRNLWKQAEQAVIDTKNGIVAGYQAEKAARRAAREAKKQQATTQPAAPQGKTYTAADMEALVRAMAQAMATAQGADVKKFEPLVQAAMKKAA